MIQNGHEREAVEDELHNTYKTKDLFQLTLRQIFFKALSIVIGDNDFYRYGMFGGLSQGCQVKI